MLDIENSTGSLKSEVSYKVAIDRSETSSIPNIYETRKIKGTFTEKLELYNFPVFCIKL